jgi:YD repeat-containing protein
VTLCDSNHTNIGGTTFTYDPHGRMATAIDARNGTTSYAYNSADLVTSATSPSPSSGQPALTTTTHYNNMLQPSNVVYPDNTSMSTESEPTGSHLNI